jgi:hypothetical protein
VERNLTLEQIMNEIHLVTRFGQGLLAVAMVIASGLFIQLTMP